jgi:hypothetical protein
LGMDQVLAKYRRHDQNYSGLRISADHDGIRRRNMEEKLETIRIMEYWLANIPISSVNIRPILQNKISEFQFEIGKSFFLLGETDNSKIFLCKALINSPNKYRTWAANVIVTLPGEGFFRSVVKTIRLLRIGFRNLFQQHRISNT